MFNKRIVHSLNILTPQEHDTYKWTYDTDKWTFDTDK